MPRREHPGSPGAGIIRGAAEMRQFRGKLRAMTAKIIDGKAIAEEIREEVRQRVEKRMAGGKPQPSLAMILVGHDAASQIGRASCRERVCQYV